MGLFNKDLFDAKTGEKAGTASRLTSIQKVHPPNFLTDKKLVDKNGNHVATQPSVVKENAGAVLGATAAVAGFFAAIIGLKD